METVVIIIIAFVATTYLAYIYGGAIKGLFFSKKSDSVKLACGHCVSCPSKGSCSSEQKDK